MSLPSVSEQMQMFKIPLELKHDHSEENLTNMRFGLRTLDNFLAGGHEKCVEQMIVYAEMNIKFLFIQALIDRKNVNEALKIFVANLMEIFLRGDELKEFMK